MLLVKFMGAIIGSLFHCRHKICDQWGVPTLFLIFWTVFYNGKPMSFRHFASGRNIDAP